MKKEIEGTRNISAINTKPQSAHNCNAGIISHRMICSVRVTSLSTTEYINENKILEKSSIFDIGNNDIPILNKF